MKKHLFFGGLALVILLLLYEVTIVSKAAKHVHRHDTPGQEIREFKNFLDEQEGLPHEEEESDYDDETEEDETQEDQDNG